MAHKSPPDSHDLTPGQAQYVIARLVSERRVSAKDVARYASEMAREIAELENRLLFLHRVAGRHPNVVRPNRPPQGENPEPTKRRRRRQKLSPERRARLRLQGQYLALLRQKSKAARARIKVLFKNKGIDAALAALRKGD